MKRIFLTVLPAVAALSLSIGCTDDRQPEEPETNRDPAAVSSPADEPDDPDALQVLSDLGANLKKDDVGHVVEISLRGTSANDETLRKIASLQHVRSLLLNDLDITADGLAALKEAHWPLTNLDLRGCPVTNDGLSQLKDISTLRALRLSGSHSAATADDAGMAFVAGLPDLKVLALDRLWISDQGIRQLQPLARLEELYLAGTTIGDDALEVIGSMRTLRKLRLSNDQISDDGLKHLTGLEHLEELDLSEDSLLSDAGMAHVGRLGSLKKLNLWRVQITDEGVRHLSSLTRLEWLNLDNTRLSNDGLPALSGLVNLRFLHLGSTQISDAGLQHLVPLKQLRDLKVTRTAVTADGVAELQKQLPDTDIQLEYLGSGT